jgi:hypothetical protein
MSMVVVSRHLETIANTLKDSPDSNRVAIRPSTNKQIDVIQEPDSCFLSAKRSFWEFVSSIASLFGKTIEPDSAIKAEDTQATKDYFQTVFGEKRLLRFDKKHTLHIEDDKKVFCRGDVLKIFVNSAEITLDDIQELFNEIKDFSKKRIRYFDESGTQTLRWYFNENDTLSSCPKYKIERLIKILSPFAKIEHVFLHHLPLKYIHIFAETEWLNMQKRVFTYHSIKNLCLQDPLWALYVAKELSSRDLPDNVIVPHASGFHYNFHFIKQGGERKYFMKQLVSTVDKCRSYLLYQGTVPFDRASRRNVMHPQLGSQGPLVTYNETHALLFDPSRGFVETEDEPVLAFGMSLGGAQAQRAKMLFGKKISELTAVCSPAIDKASAILYKGMMKTQVEKDDDSEKDKLVYIFEKDDHLDEFGGARLGLGLDPGKVKIEVYTIASAAQRNACPQAFLKKIFRVIDSSFRSHLKPIIGRDITLSKLTNDNPRDAKALQGFLVHSGTEKDPKWDEFRKIWSKRLRYDNKPEFIKFALSARPLEKFVYST